MSNHHIEAYHGEEAFPNKMTEKDKIPKKKAASERSKSKPKVPKKDMKSPPEAAARKRNMDSDFDSDYESDHDKGRDNSLEEAQKGAHFGKK